MGWVCLIRYSACTSELTLTFGLSGTFVFLMIYASICSFAHSVSVFSSHFFPLFLLLINMWLSASSQCCLNVLCCYFKSIVISFDVELLQCSFIWLIMPLHLILLLDYNLFYISYSIHCKLHCYNCQEWLQGQVRNMW